ncbi:hypothetical protein [Parasegetibacter sp. NRK P23]|uniref:hypothetical protein n=1 Tax=Parasegetibacter sp. NRK P23 TaxID=2942999 RepID=UPI002043E221|nr:hypothetical protein [Parasegetibacter sp. NRK P23]MCM5527213.1 hypothetical protein [Parasegetibacter sp. NRK P23]
MINVHDLKAGDYVIASFEGREWRGEVTGVQKDDKLVQVKTDVQEFWYPAEDVHPIPLNHEQLLTLGFEAQFQTDGSVKYLKGPFRLWIPQAGSFMGMDIWYREDRRHINRSIYVHELQNYYLAMTKVELHPN